VSEKKDKCLKCGGAGRYYVSYSAMMDRDSTPCEECICRWLESPEGMKAELARLCRQLAEAKEQNATLRALCAEHCRLDTGHPCWCGKHRSRIEVDAAPAALAEPPK